MHILDYFLCFVKNSGRELAFDLYKLVRMSLKIFFHFPLGKVNMVSEVLESVAYQSCNQG